MDRGLTEAWLETVELEWHGNTALEVGRYMLVAGEGRVADTGNYVAIWKYRGVAWQLHRSIWSTSCPSMGLRGSVAMSRRCIDLWRRQPTVQS